MDSFKKIFLISIIICSVAGLIAPCLSYAVDKSTSDEIRRQLGAAGSGGGLGAPTDPRIIAANMIRVVLGLLGMVFFALTIYAGFLWMTAGGVEEKVTKAKSLLFQAVIGLAIILSAYSITVFAAKLALGAYDKPYYEDEYLWFDMWQAPPGD